MLEAAETLVVLVESPYDQFHRIVGFWDDPDFDGIAQLGPMGREESEDGVCTGIGTHTDRSEFHHALEGFDGCPLGLGGEDMNDCFLQALWGR